MLERYYAIECLSDNSGCFTLLLESREGSERCVAKCYDKSKVQATIIEGEILSTLNHKGLPRYLGQYENDQTVCILRSYIDGATLDKIIAAGEYDVDYAVSVALQVCGILEHMHSRPEPVLHRDIKPQNIIIDADCNVHLIDFSIARIAHDSNTKDTHIAVTAEYAPPEQYGFLPTDVRSDLYSLGVVLKEMLEKINCNKKKKLEKIINRCTAFSPPNRYPSAAHLAKALKNWQRRKIYALLKVLLILAAAASFVSVGLPVLSQFLPYNDAPYGDMHVEPAYGDPYGNFHWAPFESTFKNGTFTVTCSLDELDGTIPNKLGFIRIDIFNWDNEYNDSILSVRVDKLLLTGPQGEIRLSDYEGEYKLYPSTYAEEMGRNFARIDIDTFTLPGIDDFDDLSQYDLYAEVTLLSYRVR